MNASGESRTSLGGAFETGGEHMTQEEVIMRVDCHLVFVLPEVLDGISRPRVLFEARHHELLGEAVRSDFLREV